MRDAFDQEMLDVEQVAMTTDSPATNQEQTVEVKIWSDDWQMATTCAPNINVICCHFPSSFTN
jgi:hypothetical protein